MVAEVLWMSIMPALCTGAGFSLLIEYLLQPEVVPFWRRPSSAFFLHGGLWLLFFAAELVLFQRPWFAAANVLTLLFIVVMVSNAKFNSLREPFIFQDFAYFTDALQHPRLYLPFLGFDKILLSASTYGVALWAGLSFEPSLTRQESTMDFFLAVAALGILGSVLLYLGARAKLPVTLQPEKDLRQLGLMASLWRYSEIERDQFFIPFPFAAVQPAEKSAALLPNLVVVQSESFFDVRQLFAGIRPEILTAFDSLRTSSSCWGKLAVPAWGANTVRTEFGFLSGIRAEMLGVHRFNPYRKLARQSVPTLVSFLRNLGYRTVCVHPYPASFYNRDKVFPLLGFDEFIDIQRFAGIDKTGPYIGDIDLAEKVCTLLKDASTRPIFVFVITMENHGPLHLEKVQKGEVEQFYLHPPLDSCADLTIYLRHLRNADRMASMLRDSLETLPGSGWLCWFGDHVPIMTEVYDVMGIPDGWTDYLIWEKGSTSHGGVRLDLQVEDLGRQLLAEMGLVGVPGSLVCGAA